jgi:hypothetical protein
MARVRGYWDSSRRPPSWPNLFTTAFFHQPDELRAELEEVGMVYEDTLAVQGSAWMVPEFAESWKDQRRRGLILSIARLMEREPAMSPISWVWLERSNDGSTDSQ